MPTAALAPPRLQDWNMNKRIERLAKIVLKMPRSCRRVLAFGCLARALFHAPSHSAPELTRGCRDVRAGGART
eukprot:6625066-Prymnesium_polylepis.1